MHQKQKQQQGQSCCSGFEIHTIDINKGILFDFHAIFHFLANNFKKRKKTVHLWQNQQQILQTVRSSLEIAISKALFILQRLFKRAAHKWNAYFSGEAKHLLILKSPVSSFIYLKYYELWLCCIHALYTLSSLWYAKPYPFIVIKIL